MLALTEHLDGPDVDLLVGDGSFFIGTQIAGRGGSEEIRSGEHEQEGEPDLLVGLRPFGCEDEVRRIGFGIRPPGDCIRQSRHVNGTWVLGRLELRKELIDPGRRATGGHLEPAATSHRPLRERAVRDRRWQQGLELRRLVEQRDVRRVTVVDPCGRRCGRGRARLRCRPGRGRGDRPRPRHTGRAGETLVAAVPQPTRVRARTSVAGRSRRICRLEGWVGPSDDTPRASHPIRIHTNRGRGDARYPHGVLTKGLTKPASQGR